MDIAEGDMIIEKCVITALSEIVRHGINCKGSLDTGRYDCMLLHFKSDNKIKQGSHDLQNPWKMVFVFQTWNDYGRCQKVAKSH